MYVAVLLVSVCCALAAVGVEGSGLSTCVRNYEKVGCYDEYHANVKDLVVYDRYGIKWADIVGYMHHLACTCESKVREVNKGRTPPEQYVGFALHFWGECYGRTQAQIDSLASKSKSERCTGDQTYTKCYDRNPECTGHAFSEFIYRLKPARGEMLVVTECKDTSITLNCSSSSKVSIENVSYGERTASICGSPLSIGWKPECGVVGKSIINNLLLFCDGKSSCTITKWTGSPYDPCPKVEKYIRIDYKCVA